MPNGGVGWETECRETKAGDRGGEGEKELSRQRGPRSPGWVDGTRGNRLYPGKRCPRSHHCGWSPGRQGQQRERQNELERRISKAAKLWSLLARLRSMGLKKLKGNGRPFGSIPQKTCLAWKTDP